MTNYIRQCLQRGFSDHIFSRETKIDKMNFFAKILLLPIFVLFLLAISTPTIATEKECLFEQFTKRIYVMVGSKHETCPKNAAQHPLTNPAIIVGDSGVIIIDPGSSLQVGRLVLERIKSITTKPVVAIFNSHVHGLYWLGNQAIKERFPNVRIYAHSRMIERIEGGEGLFWVQAITGKFTGEKTNFVLPNLPLKGGETEIIAGVKIKVHHTGHAHTDHDIMIEVPEEQTVFLGGIVVEPEVPSQGVPQDANFKGQISATQYAINLTASFYIPGRGEPGGIEIPKRAYRFLKALYDGVKKYYDEDFSDYEITEHLKHDLSEFQQWYDFTRLGGVVSQIYLQIETEYLG